MTDANARHNLIATVATDIMAAVQNTVGVAEVGAILRYHQHQGRFCPYAELGKPLDYAPNSAVFHGLLGQLQLLDAEADEGLRSALVVGVKTGYPGPGFFKFAREHLKLDIPRDEESECAFWFAELDDLGMRGVMPGFGDDQWKESDCPAWWFRQWKFRIYDERKHVWDCRDLRTGDVVATSTTPQDTVQEAMSTANRVGFSKGLGEMDTHFEFYLDSADKHRWRGWTSVEMDDEFMCSHGNGYDTIEECRASARRMGWQSSTT